MKLQEAFAINPGEVISLVGGGGKTTLMFALARELAGGGSTVVTTTTTKILAPAREETDLLLVEEDEGRLAERLGAGIGEHRRITLAARQPAEGKLKGISAEAITRIAGLHGVTHIIIEADGAAGRPLKAPGPDEPVIPPVTSLVVPVVGIDAVGQPLTDEYVFRAEIARLILGLPAGTIVTTDTIARLITHPQGLTKGSPAGARIAPFINKTDRDRGLRQSRRLAGQILARKHPQIERVILGQANSAPPIVEVIQKD